MNPLDALEAGCARILEGAFARAFPTPLEPVQIARKLVASFEQLPADAPVAELVVAVGARDAARLANERGYLEERWNAMLADLARERGRLDAPPTVAVEVDRTLAPGIVRIDVRRADETAPARGWVVAIRSGLPAEGQVRLDSADSAELTVGRDASCDLVLLDPRVSRRHAALAIVDGALGVRDLGSTNGVTVNGVRVDASALAAGDLVRIGDTELVVRAG
ncbi:MAG: FhaA domain-containing protein [Vulcanimicrobiaceae bacterium]